MKLIYKDLFDKVITAEQAMKLDRYTVQYAYNGKIKIEEELDKGKMQRLIYYRYDDEAHQTILDRAHKGCFFAIRETQYFGDYRLEKDFDYDSKGIFFGYSNALYDPDNNLVGSEVLDKNEAPDYSCTQKYYFDKNMTTDPDEYLFRCEYNIGGGLNDIYYLANDRCEQDAEYFSDSPACVEKLMGRTGISKALMDYYISPNVTPIEPLRKYRAGA